MIFRRCNGERNRRCCHRRRHPPADAAAVDVNDSRNNKPMGFFLPLFFCLSASLSASLSACLSASLSASLSAFLAAFLSAFRFSLSLFLFGSEELFGSSTQRSISFKSSRQRQLAGYKQDRKKERMKERKRERKEGVLTGRRRRREKSNAESQPEIVFKYQR